jgi:cytochrome P450
VSDELREKLAYLQHDIWASWMRYMFTCGTLNPDGTWTMPAEKVQRWQRQMVTPYSELTDNERESDRQQADKMLTVLPRAQDSETRLSEKIAEIERRIHMDNEFLAHLADLLTEGPR